MATNVNKMIILVATKGVKESSKEMDKATESGKKLGGQIKENTETIKNSEKAQTKLTNTMGEFNYILPNVASAVYLLQKGYNLLSGAIGEVTEAHLDNLTAQIKLETILNSTGNAVGYTADQIELMAREWRGLTGIHEASIKELAGIASTFTQISQEVFPDTIEQALNMSTIFGQDLQQSMVQLGTSLNSPIAGIGRLRRIGISFTETQREMIKEFIAQNDIVSAQKVILDELNLELGNTARAMGDDLPGDIKRFESAMKDLKILLGETITDALNPLRVGLTDLINDFVGGRELTKNFDSFATKVASFGRELNRNLPEGVSIFDAGLPAELSLGELEAALNIYTQKLSSNEGIIESIRENIHGITDPEGMQTTLNYLAQMETSYANNSKMLKLIEERLDTVKQLIKDTNADVSLDNGQDTWLRNLREAIAYKEAQLNIDVNASKYEKDRVMLEAEKVKWLLEAQNLNIAEKDVLAIINSYLEKKGALINAEEQAQKRLNEEKQRNADRNLLIITDEQKALSDFISYWDKLYLALERGTISQQEYNKAIEDYQESLKEIKEDVSVGSFAELWSIQLKDIVNDTQTAIDWTKSFEESLDSLYLSLGNLGAGALSESLDSIGESFRDSDDAASNWQNTMVSLIDSTLEAVGPQLMLAGATALAENWKNPVGWALLAAGGGASLLGGYIDSSGSGSSASSSETQYLGTTTTTLNPTGTDLSSSSTSSSSSSRGVTMNVFNNAGVDVETTESTGTDGTKVLDVVLASVKSKYKVTERTVPVGSR